MLLLASNFFLIFLCEGLGFITSFRYFCHRSSTSSVPISMAYGKLNTPSLSENSLWKLTIFLQKEGFQSIEAKLRIRFIQSKNYEPPQGRIFIEDDYNGLVRVDEEGYGGIWTLSEDKDDRKDGLWIWGLFEEPKYPYIYFYLDIYPTVIVDKNEYKVPQKLESDNGKTPTVPSIDKEKIFQGINNEIKDNSYLNSVLKVEIKNPKITSSSPVNSNSDTSISDSSSREIDDQIVEIPIFDGKTIVKNRLNFRFDFFQKSMKDGVSLTNGDVNYQLTETVNADPFGIGGKVDIGDYVNAGRVNILYVPDE